MQDEPEEDELLDEELDEDTCPLELDEEELDEDTCPLELDEEELEEVVETANRALLTIAVTGGIDIAPSEHP